MSLTRLQQLVRSGQFTQAMQVFEVLLQDQSATKSDLAYAYHCASVCQYRLENFHAAQDFGFRSEELARDSGDMELLGRIWVNLIAITMDCGDTTRALEFGDLWLTNLDDHFPQLRALEARVHFNMGQAHRYRKNRTAMFQHFQAAVDLSRNGKLPADTRVLFHQVYAWCQYAAERIAEGDEQAQAALALVEDEDTEGIREQLLLQAYRAYQIGDHKAALQLAQEFISPGSLVTGRQHFWSLWIISMAASDSGQFEWAIAMSDLALAEAIQLKLSEYMNAANQAKSKARRLQQIHKEDPDTAG